MVRKKQKKVYLTKGQRNKLNWIKNNAVDYEDMGNQELANWLLNVKIQELISKVKKIRLEENSKHSQQRPKVLVQTKDSYHSHENVPAFSEFVNIPNLSKGFTDFIY